MVDNRTNNMYSKFKASFICQPKIYKQIWHKQLYTIINIFFRNQAVEHNALESFFV